MDLAASDENLNERGLDSDDVLSVAGFAGALVSAGENRKMCIIV